MSEKIYRQLGALLDKERAALLQGDFDGVLAHSDEKERLLTMLQTTSGTPTQLAELSHRIAHNQALLTAAMAGVKSAEDGLATLHKNAMGSTVYGKDGATARLSGGTTQMSHKV